MGRMEKINRQLVREISTMILHDLADPRFMFVTITRADVSPDLHQARVYFSVLGVDATVEPTQKALQSASGMVRLLVSKRMNLRHTPTITFCYDKSIEQSARMEETLNELKREREEGAGVDPQA